MVLLAKSYKVILKAASGKEALKICKEHVGPIPLMVTDGIMPHISGQELARKVREMLDSGRKPDLGSLIWGLASAVVYKYWMRTENARS